MCKISQESEPSPPKKPKREKKGQEAYQTHSGTKVGMLGRDAGAIDICFRHDLRSRLMYTNTPCSPGQVEHEAQ